MKYFLSIIIFLPLFVFAHGGGQTIREVVGEYILSLETVTEQVQTGSAERFNLEIEQNIGTGPVVFSNVWVRITAPTGEFLFSGSLENKAPLGFSTGMSYLFSMPGIYEISARFEDSGETVAETSFALPVARGQGPRGLSKETASRTLYGFYKWGLPLILLVVGFIVGKFFSSSRFKP